MPNLEITLRMLTLANTPSMKLLIYETALNIKNHDKRLKISSAAVLYALQVGLGLILQRHVF